MVKKTNKKRHESVLPQQKREWKSGRIQWHRDDRFRDTSPAKGRMQHCGCATEQRSFQHDRAIPANGRNSFKHHSLIAPDKYLPLSGHPPEKILVLSGPKLRPEWRLAVRKKLRFQQQVARPRLAPAHHEARLMRRPLIEVALDDPVWRRIVEVTFHGSEHTGYAILGTGFEQVQQPILLRKFIVIDAGDELPAGVLNCFVPRQRYILPRLDAVLDLNGRRSREGGND